MSYRLIRVCSRNRIALTDEITLKPQMETHIETLAAALITLGCPTEKSSEMALQLDKRARQLSEQKGRPYEEALKHLLQLMQQGWAAKGRGQ